MPESHNKSLSIIIPVLNEQDVISELLLRLKKIVDALGVDHEIIFVDDKSTDGTISEIMKYRPELGLNIRIIVMRKNVGHMNALEVGLKNAKFELVATMDADLQDPPELICDMYKIFLQDKDKIDVVQGVRTDRAIDTFFKRNSANFFYKLMQKLIGSQVIPHAGDFRMMTFESVKIILNQKTRKKIYRFLIPQMGFRVEKISYVRSERFAGETKYPLGKMLKLAVESITEFSSKPLRILAKIGVTIAFISLILTAVIFIAHFSFAWIPGWASLVTLFLSINGFVIFAVGILGVYIAEIFDEIKSNITIYDEI